MKRLFYKHILRAKYMVDNPTKFFWSLDNAIAQCKKTYGKNIVWTINYKQAYVQQGAWASIHPDAANFNPHQ